MRHFQTSAVILCLGVFLLVQAEALRLLTRAAVPAEEDLGDDEDPQPQGRIFSIVRESEPSRYSPYDSKPIIISAPASHPPPYYGQPPLPPTYPQIIPVPVPAPPPPFPPTIIKPVVSRPHHHHHGHHGPGGWGGGYGFPPFINITYSPIMAAATTETTTNIGSRNGLTMDQQQISDLAQLSQLLLAQAQIQAQAQAQAQVQPQLVRPNQVNPAILAAQPQLQQFQPQLQALPNSVIYQPFNGNQDQTYGLVGVQQTQPNPQLFLPPSELFDINVNDEDAVEPERRPKPQYYVRRSQKPRKKSKKTKKAKIPTQTIYLTLPQAALPVEAQAETQANIMQPSMQEI